MTDLTEGPQVMIVFPNQGYFVPAKDSALMKQLMQLNLNAPAPKIAEPAPVKRVEFVEPAKVAEPAKIAEPAVKPLDLSKVAEPAIKPVEHSPAVEPAKVAAKPAAPSKEQLKQQLGQVTETLDKLASSSSSAPPKKFTFTQVIAAAPKVAPEVKVASVAPKTAKQVSGKCQSCNKNPPFQPHLKYCYHCFNNLPFCYQGCNFRTDHASGLCSFCYQESLKEEQYDDEPLDSSNSAKCTRCEMNWTSDETGICGDCHYAMTKTCENKKNKCDKLTQGHKFCKPCWEGIIKQTQGKISSILFYCLSFFLIFFYSARAQDGDQCFCCLGGCSRRVIGLEFFCDCLLIVCTFCDLINFFAGNSFPFF